MLKECQINEIVIKPILVISNEEYKDKLISSYEAKSASVTIDTFNELISKLINVD